MMYSRDTLGLDASFPSSHAALQVPADLRWLVVLHCPRVTLRLLLTRDDLVDITLSAPVDAHGVSLGFTARRILTAIAEWYAGELTPAQVALCIEGPYQRYSLC